ncbi:Maf family protein [Actinomadura namibiensis]|uniref:Nucleoside triphosphate pyrophosphatase n=2 Tax=Actinomadura TaxID=1988 RepID=A0A7W3LVR1_ACTNM|nr:nucleoside triphosphate pyrophosphatase [Actinomadura namibiensis]MBA8955216.1 septum formation protein [Actinomadura namibiensis]
MTKVVLASGSPSRLDILRRAGVEPVVMPSDVDETPLPGETPSRLALRLAEAKASAVARGVTEGFVIGGDSVLELDGTVYGKPGDPQTAVEVWRRISGREAAFHTGHCVIDVAAGRTVTALGTTTVRFAKLSDEEIAEYVKTGEPLAVAGAFKSSHRGGWFVEGIDGDPTNVQGLSLSILRRLFTELGVSVASLWNAWVLDLTGGPGR